MGYERKLFIVNEHIRPDLKKEYSYAWTIAMFDISKCYELNDVEWTEAKATLYDAYNGDKEIKEDLYGDAIVSADPKEVADCLDKVYKDCNYYEAKVCADLIRGCMGISWCDHLKIYSYGY